jgi:hypothetical protein
MMQVDTEGALGVIIGWFRACMTRLWGNDPKRGIGMVMACPLWGADYVERFGKLCLPSIVSPRNLAALKNRARIVIFTDSRSAPRILEMLDYLEHFGIKTIVWEAPTSVMEKVKGNAVYWFLGACQNLAVQMCRRWGMGLHMLQPDHIYCDGYFENLFRIQGGAPCIAQTSISADLMPAQADLKKYVNADGELVVPPRDLATIGYKHLHKQMQMYAMNNCSLAEDRMPNSHYMFWQTRDKLMIYCCHMNPAWLSPEICAIVPIPQEPGAIASTLDSRLPFILPNGVGVYVPGVDDGVVFIELSDGNKQAVPSFVDKLHFVSTAWGQVFFFDEFMPYFEQVCEIPIKPRKKFVTESEVIRQHAEIIEFMKARKGEAAIARWQAVSGFRRSMQWKM